MDKTLDPSSPVSRFIFDRNQIRKNEPGVKYRAFLPGADGTLSVYRVLNLNDEEIWEIAVRHVEPGRGKKALARGDCLIKVFQQHNLQIEPDEDPPRHANIVGFPEEKDLQKSITMEIAAQAKLALRIPGEDEA